MSADEKKVMGIHEATKKNKESVVRAILEDDATKAELVDEDMNTPLLVSVRLRHLKVSSCLVSYAPHTDETGLTALAFASIAGSTECVELLLSTGKCDPNLANRWCRTPLQQSAKLGSLGCVAALLFSGAKPNGQDHWRNTALMYATLRGHSVITTCLMEAGADPNLLNQGGRSALHLAAINGHTSIIARLLAKGALLNVQDAEKYTPLLLACKSGQRPAIEMLLDAGADPHLLEAEGHSVMHYLASLGDIDFIDRVLTQGVNPDICNSKGYSPLALAALKSQEHVILRLLQWNCDVTINCSFGGKKVPLLEIVVRHGKLLAAAILKLAGGELSDNSTSWDTISGSEGLQKMFRAYSPRLQDLCRLQLRKVLGVNLRKVRLNLPPRLLKFVYMEDIVGPIGSNDVNLTSLRDIVYPQFATQSSN